MQYSTVYPNQGYYDPKQGHTAQWPTSDSSYSFTSQVLCFFSNTLTLSYIIRLQVWPRIYIVQNVNTSQSHLVFVFPYFVSDNLNNTPLKQFLQTILTSVVGIKLGTELNLNPDIDFVSKSQAIVSYSKLSAAGLLEWNIEVCVHFIWQK